MSKNKKTETNYFGRVPDDVITDILTRLPIHQISLCNTVCRRWHSLIGTPDFVETHQRRVPNSVPLIHWRRPAQHPTENELLFAQDRNSITYRNDPNMGLYRRVRLTRSLKEKTSWPHVVLRGSYHGLLLFQEQQPLRNSGYSIVNPLTSDVVTFQNRDTVCGLYYHPPAGQYRLLCLRHVAGTDTFLYYARSIHYVNPHYKEVGRFASQPETDEYGVQVTAVAANGCLYWPGKSDRCHIILFDLVNETLRLMPCPPPPRPLRDHDNDIHIFHGLEATVRNWDVRIFERASRLHLQQRVGKNTMLWVLEDEPGWRWAELFNDWTPTSFVAFSIRGACYFYLGRRWLAIFRYTRVDFEELRFGNWRNNPIADSASVINWKRSFIRCKDYL